ncbi:MAG: S1/P1 nuclease [Bryobacteraceae bacterium]
MPRTLSRLIAICCILWTCPALGWWETGHRTVARIAAAHLTPAARIRIARILNVPDNVDAIAEALALGSTWADEIKKDTHTDDWHYVDLTLQDLRSDISARCKDDNCVVARIRLFTAQLAAQKADGRWSELDALRFLVHFVGDVHQPLHAISDADLGGNCERIDPPINEAKNIHALWDGGIVNALDASDKVLASRIDAYVAALGESERKEFSSGSVEDWTWESHELARKLVYSKLQIPTEPILFPKGCAEAPSEITGFKAQVDSLYVDDMKPVVRDQLAKAGLRLARVLNESL